MSLKFGPVLYITEEMTPSQGWVVAGLYASRALAHAKNLEEAKTYEDTDTVLHLHGLAGTTVVRQGDVVIYAARITVRELISLE